MQQLLGAYAMSGQMDSTIKYARKVIELDSTSAAPAVMVVNLMKDSLQYAGDLLDLIQRRGTAEDKENVAVLLVNGAYQVLRPFGDGDIDTVRLARSAELARRAVDMADSSQNVWHDANHALLLGNVFFIASIDTLAEESQSCPLARREEALRNEALSALAPARPTNAYRVDQYRAYLEGLKDRVYNMLRSYCS
jgi:hypothetical protein